MQEKMDVERRKLEEKKERILAKQKVLDEKMKRQKIKKFIEIGRIAEKARIEEVEKEILLGAFLGIAQRMENENFIENCRSAAQEFELQSTDTCSQIAITFKELPSKEVARSLKELGFHWNRFRKEFYGKGSVESIQKAVGSVEFALEEIPD